MTLLNSGKSRLSYSLWFVYETRGFGSWEASKLWPTTSEIKCTAHMSNYYTFQSVKTYFIIFILFNNESQKDHQYCPDSIKTLILYNLSQSLTFNHNKLTFLN